ncbi:hypothetical protein DF049_30885 [Burkholderia cenocepacia]|uniref:hypothetical protein n=1 Tax=Burkholderia cenocepacia TaxID=95486 RepID=UPI000F563B30|nr:hypothetical protein [Burkholderia cenocepacia]RQU70691.1 hypothetical protein DF049_30885 [Burkholderia cenocepacia]RQV03944.1 hypothetical protein DF042_12165 [Burkholderia cenocepacia]
MDNTPRSARQLETMLLGCINRAAESTEEHCRLNDRPRSRAFAASLCGALESHGYLALAKAFAAGAGLEHLYPAEDA